MLRGRSTSFWIATFSVVRMASTGVRAMRRANSDFHGRLRPTIQILRAKQIIRRLADRVLHDHAHVDDVLIAGEEFEASRLNAPQHQLVGNSPPITVAAVDGP